MLARFSLYGFLKNQRYFEPFLVLFLLDKLHHQPLAFTLIGVLIGFRSVCINLMEIPTGVIADLWGRRRSMLLGWASYIVSFVLFALAPAYWMLFPAMFFFAVGEAFRTGTHKAMIFTWLRDQGRIAEKTKVYGYTRSWSKAGSAVSVVIAGALVFFSGSYSYIFWLCLPPYIIGLINLATYPRSLDEQIVNQGDRLTLGRMFRELGASMKLAVTTKGLRGLFVESMGFEGLHDTVKDYLQPMLKQAALALPLFIGLASEKRTAILISAAYLAIHVASTIASRQAHRVQDWAGSDRAGARRSWEMYVATYAVLLGLLLMKWYTVAIVAFVALEILQNIWRPILMSRFDAVTPPERQATVLSIESQAQSAFTMVAAPLLGLAVDMFGFWPIGMLGLCLAVLGTLHSWRLAAKN